MPKTKLKPVTTLFVVLIFLHTHLEFCSGVPILGLDSLKAGDLEAMVRRACAGKIGECAAEEEAEMDSETNRRVLVMQRRRYISYDTLKRDLTPCTRPGASYYNCKAAGQANPYNRGCGVITGCARDINDIKS